MRTLTDIQKRILKEEYPNMNLESDSDVERYFELRSLGRQSEALDIYTNKLKRKYPNEEQRTLLMRYYRSHDPRYQLILRENLVTLAENIIKRTTYIISFLTKEIDTVNMKDAYSVIKLVEGLLAVISPDRYVAIAFTEKYVRYAKSLNYRFVQMERTAELIRLYVTDTIESVQEFKRENEEKKKKHAHQQRQQNTKKTSFDLTKITFTPSDLERILISNTITRTEDIVISYCIKYWSLVNDPAFEKTVFLYSRKYKTHNNDIFQAIKNGRNHSWKDEEILNAVLSNVVTGYYYNISGDLYLQKTWARIKATSQLQETAITIDRGPASKPSKKRAPIVRLQKEPKPVTPFKARKTSNIKVVPELPAVPTIVSNSIINMIKKMTGKTYTVYKDLFFQSIRPSIRTGLASALYKKTNLFDNKQNAAEEILYKFLFNHFNDPYQKWQESAEQKQLEELGYKLPGIEPIIAHWIELNQ